MQIYMMAVYFLSWSKHALGRFLIPTKSQIALARYLLISNQNI